ncbi:hypothetical protein Y032_0181g864 [Ancylostoma ceylanicum]|uniref:17S U2 SnRNP complex component HTATSF1 n=1 Tax=Ancylostoma ceylanicum TaxID=53326 RepID=A0A016SSQ1_9BILA|nr:hypothetical protein Y032_0181g864 [Ancylostoma ceylanicum]
MAANNEEVVTAPEQDDATKMDQEAAPAANGDEVTKSPEPGDVTKVDQEAPSAAKGEEVAAAPEPDDAAKVDQEAPVNSNTAASMEKIEGFSTRYLNEKWIGRYDDTGQYMEYHNNQWRPLPEDDLMFIQQLWLEQEAAETQVVNGVKMKWNAAAQEWQRADQEVDEDFIASYQANYGVQYDYSKMDEERKAKEAEKLRNNPTEKEEKKKGKGPTEPQGWVDMEEKVHAVYVNNLPLDITLDEFKEFMSKCGVIQPDARTNKPKLKLYVDENGELKGDGRCVYIKKESVDLALSILDGFNLRGKEVHVEKARFEQKGEFDPTKKRKKLTNAQKKRYMENQNRIFEWKPEKPRNYRPISDCTVVIKNLFTLQMMESNAALMMDLKEEVQESCSKYGTVKKVVVYDTNPEGVVTVTFETTDESDMAVKMLNGRIVDGRRLEVSLWDGKTKYKVQESEEDRQRRLAAWQNFIKGDSDEEEEKDETSKQQSSPKSSSPVKDDVKTTKKSEEGLPPEKRPRPDDEVDTGKAAENSSENSEEGPSPEKRPKLDDGAEQ